MGKEHEAGRQRAGDLEKRRTAGSMSIVKERATLKHRLFTDCLKGPVAVQAGQQVDAEVGE